MKTGLRKIIGRSSALALAVALVAVATEASAQAAAHWMEDGCYYVPVNGEWVQQACRFYSEGGSLIERNMLNGYEMGWVPQLGQWMDANQLTQLIAVTEQEIARRKNELRSGRPTCADIAGQEQIAPCVRNELPNDDSRRTQEESAYVNNSNSATIMNSNVATIMHQQQTHEENRREQQRQDDIKHCLESKRLGRVDSRCYPIP